MSGDDRRDVRLHGQHVGTLFRLPSGAFLFEPDPPRPGPHTLSLAMNQAPGPRRGVGLLPSWFENLLPPKESALRLLLERSSGRHTSWGLLGWLGADLPGAVEVTGDTDDRADERPPPITRRTSLGGMQLKFSLLSDGGRLTLPMAGRFGNAIGKLARSEWPDLPRIELTTMRWAAASGVTVPDAAVHPVSDLPELTTLAATCAPEIYVVSRFDRPPDGRVHQEDLCQVFEFAPSLLYGGDSQRRSPRATVRSILQLIHRACGLADAEQALRRIAFEIVSGNTDAHLKNWALWYPDKVRPRLSPAYDQVCVIALPGFGWDAPGPPKAALSLAGSKSLVDLDLARMRRLLSAAQLDGLPAEDLFVDGVRRALAAWPSVADGAPPSMTAALQLHHAAVPLIHQLHPRVIAAPR